MFKFNISYLIYAFLIVTTIAIFAVQLGNEAECEAAGGRYMKEFLEFQYECLK